MSTKNIKVGDKIRVLSTQSDSRIFKYGDERVAYIACIRDDVACPYYAVTDKSLIGMPYIDLLYHDHSIYSLDEIELIDEYLKKGGNKMKLQDLKRGMRCTDDEGDIYIVDKVTIDHSETLSSIDFIGKSSNGFSGVCGVLDDLTTVYNEGDIVKVEDITVDGFEVIWERPKKYYLRLPNATSYDKAYLKYRISDGKYYFGHFEAKTKRFKTQFTQEEIDDLPNQDFVQSLIKDEVE